MVEGLYLLLSSYSLTGLLNWTNLNLYKYEVAYR